MATTYDIAQSLSSDHMTLRLRLKIRTETSAHGISVATSLERLLDATELETVKRSLIAVAKILDGAPA